MDGFYFGVLERETLTEAGHRYLIKEFHYNFFPPLALKGRLPQEAKGLFS